METIPLCDSVQYEMRQAQIREQEEHQQRIQQLEAYSIQNEIRCVENREAANERREDAHLSQQAEQFRREQEALSEAIRLE
jgi:hypothetical protein